MLDRRNTYNERKGMQVEILIAIMHLAKSISIDFLRDPLVKKCSTASLYLLVRNPGLKITYK